MEIKGYPFIPKEAKNNEKGPSILETSKLLPLVH